MPLVRPQNDFRSSLRDENKSEIFPEGLEKARMFTREGLANLTSTSAEGVVGAV